MDFIWNVEYIIMLSVCFIAVTFKLPKPSKLWWVRLSIGILVWFGIWFIRLIPGYQIWADILLYFAIYLAAIITAMFTYGLNWQRALFVVAVMGTVQHAAYKFSLAFLCLFDPELRHSYYVLLTELIAVCISFAIMTFTFGKRLRESDFPINNILTFATAGALAVATIAISFYTQEELYENLSDVPVVLALVNLLSFLLCLSGVALLYESIVAGTLKQENYILHMLSRKDKERYEAARRSSEVISIKYHDLKHALNERTLDEEERLELEKTETDYMSLMFSGNRALDLILIEKRRLGEEEGVHMQMIVDGSLMNFMKSYQIYSMFGNILDNAIEACVKLPSPQDKIIHLKVFKNRGNVVVECVNKVVGPVEFVNGLPKTTKEHSQNHGYGMKSVRSLCNRYGGMMQAKVEEGKFILKLVFPYKESEPTE